MEPVCVFGVWAALLTLGLLFLSKQSENIPYRDEWIMVPLITGNEPLTAAALWERHNEHRLPLPRALYLGIMSASGDDFRVGRYVNLLLLAVVCLIFLRTVRTIRGRLIFVDVFIPLVWLHYGHSENIAWSFQIQFILGVAIFAVVVHLLAIDEWRRKPVQAAALGSCLLAVSLCGMQAILMLVLPALWLLVAGLFCSRAGSARLAWAIVTSSSILGLAISALTIYGYSTPGRHAAPEFNRIAVENVLQVLAISLGPGVAPIWLPIGLLLVAGSIMAVFRVGRVVANDDSQRVRGVAWIMVIASAFALACAIGAGRAPLPYDNGLNARYAALSAFLPTVLYLMLPLYWDSVTAHRRQLVLVILATALLVPNINSGLQIASYIHSLGQVITADVRNDDLSLAYVTREYASDGRVYAYDPQPIERWLTMMRRAGIGPYRDADSLATRFEEAPPIPDSAAPEKRRAVISSHGFTSSAPGVDGWRLTSSGTDAWFYLSDWPAVSTGTLLWHVDLTVPADTTVEVVQGAERSKRLLAAGRNSFYVATRALPEDERPKLLVGHSAGDYVLHGLEARPAAGR